MTKLPAVSVRSFKDKTQFVFKMLRISTTLIETETDARWLNVAYRHYVNVLRHPAQHETDDDVDHHFYDVDFRLRKSRGAMLTFDPVITSWFIGLRPLIDLFLTLVDTGWSISFSCCFSHSSTCSSDWFIGSFRHPSKSNVDLCLATHDSQDLPVGEDKED